MDGIHLDYTNCLAEQVGSHGITTDDLERANERLAGITADLASTRGTGWERWRDLPFDPMRTEHVGAVNELADQHRRSTDTLVVLGIGGSALGTIALQAALNPLTWNLLPADKRHGPRLFVLDNADPQLVGDVLSLIQSDDPNFDRTLFNVISKSGETAETAAQFMIVREMLQNARGDRAAERVVATTDPKSGTMRRICDASGYTTLPVPDGVGGRFSVLSPVGLFSAAMCGIDINALLDGAASMDARCCNEDSSANPAALLAWLLVTFMERGKPLHVMMPYSNALSAMADWYKQLWAESLGKSITLDDRPNALGPTPIRAIGATDQHSQVQLYREGPNDKVFGLLHVEDFGRDVPTPCDAADDALSYLTGSSLRRLLHAEEAATSYALTESERPNYTIHLPRLDATSIGAFIQLWQMATAYAGRLMNIDAFNQPAVETGKVATFGLMGRDGFSEWAAKVDALRNRPRHTV